MKQAAALDKQESWIEPSKGKNWKTLSSSSSSMVETLKFDIEFFWSSDNLKDQKKVVKKKKKISK